MGPRYVVKTHESSKFRLDDDGDHHRSRRFAGYNALARRKGSLSEGPLVVV
jgi:hypothetical protein